MRDLIDTFKALTDRWTWKMAWRDSRSQRPRILLYLSSIMVGVAALVAIRSFGANVAYAIDQQAHALLGADLVVRSRRAFDENVVEFLDSIPAVQTKQRAFPTMGFFPRTQSARLVQVRASEPGFPWYGEVKTDPANAFEAVWTKKGALVDETLMIQFEAKVGDTIRLGELELPIVGALQQMPGESFVVSQLAPRVIIPYEVVEKTGLLKFGSMVAYRRAYKYPDDFDDTAIVEQLEELKIEKGISFDTVESRSERLGNRLSNLFSFLGLVGFVALLLGGIGVASSVHVYVREKLPNVAMLRCVGALAHQTFAVYLLQALIMGVIGGVGGAVLGVIVQHLLPKILAGYLPVNLELQLSISSILIGTIAGVAVTFLFSLLPLIRVRRVSPLMTLRMDFEATAKRDKATWVVYVLIALAVVAAALVTAPDLKHGLGFVAALVGAFAALSLLAWVFMAAVRRFTPSSLPYVVRQGLSNLYRPRNQTLTVLLCIGLGVFLIMGQYLDMRQLVSYLERSEQGENPNMVLFNVQDDELPGVRELLREQNLPLMDEVPIVTMRIKSIKGRTVEEIRRIESEKPRGERMERWVLNREYRSTYRDSLNSSEELLRGEFIPSVPAGTERIPVSVERDIAEDLHVDIGDEIVFDVQGIPITTYVASIRQVDWYKMQPNFFMVFPKGVLEEAPKMNVVVTKTPSPQASSKLQVAAIKKFPSVALLDLTQVVETFSNILDKMSFAVRFMALFSIATGVLVLISSVQNTRNQRLRENALLRTLGASGNQVLVVMATEYFLLGFLAVNAGNLLAVLWSIIMCKFFFEVEFSMEWWPLLVSNAVVIGITIVIGLGNTLLNTRKPPLEILREPTT